LKSELVKVLSDITETKLIANILKNMNNKDILNLLSLLDFADEETKKRWLNTYNQLIKF
jgi:bifunctional N-acetylglucosamine-1-phosphate-uridyltransferase/glucosamine-1-phosphate-acetyltransferase GlmU-like protein